MHFSVHQPSSHPLSLDSFQRNTFSTHDAAQASIYDGRKNRMVSVQKTITRWKSYLCKKEAYT